MRRPLRAFERPHLLNVGRLLRTTREACGLTRAELALHADISREQVWRIENGRSRTYASTLRRLAAGLAVTNRSLSFERLAGDLIDAAGPALADESVHADRIARRRLARAERAWQEAERDERAAAGRFLQANQNWPDGQLRTEYERDQIWFHARAVLTESLEELRERRAEIQALCTPDADSRGMHSFSSVQPNCTRQASSA